MLLAWRVVKEAVAVALVFREVWSGVMSLEVLRVEIAYRRRQTGRD